MPAHDIDTTVVTTEATTTGTAWVTYLTHPASKMTANVKYLILIYAHMSSSVTSASNELCRVAHGVTPTLFTGTDFIVNAAQAASTLTEEDPFMFVWTQPATAEDVVVQFASDGTKTARMRNCRVVTIALNADVEFAETSDASGPTNHTASYVTRATLTWTPDNAGDDWLIVASVKYVLDNQNKNVFSRIVDAADSPYRREVQWEPQRSSEEYGFVVPWVIEGAPASLQTVKFQSRDESAAGGDTDYMSCEIVALNLDSFESHVIATVAGPTSVAVANTWEEFATAAAYAPTTTGNQVLIGDVSMSRDGSFERGKAKLAVNETDLDDREPLTYLGHSDPTDDHNGWQVGVVSIPSSGQDVDLDIRAGGLTADFRDGLIVAFSYELAGVAPAPLFPRRQQTVVRM